jgi:hypothetical protein
MGTAGFISQGTRMAQGASPKRLRAPWRRGAWSSAEVALALQRQRAELSRTLATRGDARGLSETVLEEVLNDAISIVVMMRKPIVSEEHLLGAFWTTARILLRQYRDGRHGVRVGSRPRVGLESVAAHVVSDDLGPDDVLALKDRVARAADFVAQLDELERAVVAVMAVRGAGIKATARILEVPVKTVKAAQRSAQGKLDRIALIAAAGRMCDYRQPAITAYALGSTDLEDERIARVHLAACASCRSSYALLRREMHSRAFQRDAAAALLPLPALPVGYHMSLLGRLIGWSSDRPHFGGERAAELIGGAGAVKVAAAGSAVIVATATIASGIHVSLTPHPSRHHRHAHAAVRRAVKPQPIYKTPLAASTAPPHTSATTTTRAKSATHLTPRQHAELEFGSLRSPRSSSATHTSAPTASAASAQTSAEGSDSSEVPRSESSGASGAQTQSRPSAADREFGQP